jgi:hypothetical protein
MKKIVYRQLFRWFITACSDKAPQACLRAARSAVLATGATA